MFVFRGGLKENVRELLAAHVRHGDVELVQQLLELLLGEPALGLARPLEVAVRVRENLAHLCKREKSERMVA